MQANIHMKMRRDEKANIDIKGFIQTFIRIG